MIQLITPNPYIPCRPGWCLQYVRQAFGLPARYGTATEAWEKSASQHRDRDFPAGVWLPVWYGLDNEPAGHVVLMAPDGSCYSTSDIGSTPHHHPDLGDLERYYAYYGMTLTYRGWTEDVASYPVIAAVDLAAQGTITADTIITKLQEAGMALDLSDRQFIQEVVNGANTTAVAEIRAQTEHWATQLAEKIADSDYQMKVFTQQVVNPRVDEVLATLNGGK